MLKLDVLKLDGQLMGYLVKNIFMGKVYREHALKLVTYPFLKFVSSTF